MTSAQIAERAKEHARKMIDSLEVSALDRIPDEYNDALLEGLASAFIDGFCDSLRIVKAQTKAGPTR